MKNEKENMASKETELNLEEVGNEIVGGSIGVGSYTETAVAGVKNVKLLYQGKRNIQQRKVLRGFINAGDAVYVASRNDVESQVESQVVSQLVGVDTGEVVMRNSIN